MPYPLKLSRSLVGLSVLVVSTLTHPALAQELDDEDAPAVAPSPSLPSAASFPAEPPTATFPAEPPTPAPAPPPSSVAPPPSSVAPPARTTLPAQTLPPSTPAPKATPSPLYQSAPFDSTPPRAPDATATESAPPAPAESGASEDSGDDIIRLGPVVGIGLPNLLNFGGMLKLTRYLAGGINVGLIPATRISLYGEATLSYQEYDIYGRIHPFGGGFFLGAGVGYATIKGTVKDNLDTSPYASQLPASLSIPNPLVYESQGSVKTMILTPQVGYFYTTDIGFSIGLDVGAQVPIAPSEVKYTSQVALPAGTPQLVADQIKTQLLDPNDKKVKDTLDTIGRTPLPTVNIRVGWLF